MRHRDHTVIGEAEEVMVVCVTMMRMWIVVIVAATAALHHSIPTLPAMMIDMTDDAVKVAADLIDDQEAQTDTVVTIALVVMTVMIITITEEGAAAQIAVVHIEEIVMIVTKMYTAAEDDESPLSLSHTRTDT